MLFGVSAAMNPHMLMKMAAPARIFFHKVGLGGVGEVMGWLSVGDGGNGDAVTGAFIRELASAWLFLTRLQ